MSTIISHDAAMVYACISYAVLMSVNFAMMFFGMYSAHGMAMLFLSVIAVWVGSLVVAYALATYERQQPSRPAKPRRAAGASPPMKSAI